MSSSNGHILIVDDELANLSRQQLRERFAREAAASPPEDERVLSADERFLQHAREVIGAHLADSDFDVEQLAAALAMERSTEVPNGAIKSSAGGNKGGL